MQCGMELLVVPKCAKSMSSADWFIVLVLVVSDRKLAPPFCVYFVAFRFLLVFFSSSLKSPTSVVKMQTNKIAAASTDNNTVLRSFNQRSHLTMQRHFPRTISRPHRRCYSGTAASTPIECQNYCAFSLTTCASDCRLPCSACLCASLALC